VGTGPKRERGLSGRGLSGRGLSGRGLSGTTCRVAADPCQPSARVVRHRPSAAQCHSRVLEGYSRGASSTNGGPAPAAHTHMIAARLTTYSTSVCGTTRTHRSGGVHHSVKAVLVGATQGVLKGYSRRTQGGLKAALVRGRVDRGKNRFAIDQQLDLRARACVRARERVFSPSRLQAACTVGFLRQKKPNVISYLRATERSLEGVLAHSTRTWRTGVGAAAPQRRVRRR
jgi:hypothetical protein